jgi:hypothetical protein
LFVHGSEGKSNAMKLYKQTGNKVELCILPRLEAEVNKLFEKEIRDGYREELPDGRIYFVFEVSTKKATLLHWVSRWIEHEGRQGREFMRDEQRNVS